MPSPELQNKRPLEFGYFIQDLTGLAVAAGKAGDHVSEARFYRALAKAVPTESIAFTKLCEALEAAGDRDKAILACRDALGREGVVLKDYVHLVTLELGKSAPLSAQENEDVKQIVLHLKDSPDTKATGTMLECEYAVHVDDLKLLRSCSSELAALAPNDAATISFAWTLAMRNGDMVEARRLVQAAEAGVRPDSVERMTVAIDNRGRRGFVAKWRGPISLGGAFLFAALAGLTYYMLRRRRGLGVAAHRLTAAGRSARPSASRATGPTGGHAASAAAGDPPCAAERSQAPPPGPPALPLAPPMLAGGGCATSTLPRS